MPTSPPPVGRWPLAMKPRPRRWPWEKDLQEKMKFVEKSRLFVEDGKVFFSTIRAIVPVLTAKAFSENPRPSTGESIIVRVF